TTTRTAHSPPETVVQSRLYYHARFVRNIYVVTSGQVPSWLNVEHPQVTVVSHRELYPDAAVLPTFNSSSIETVLHRIEGLSEHFLYFNDDMMLGAPVTRHDFFSLRMQPKYFPAGQKVFLPDIDATSEEYIVADVNAMQLFQHELYPFGNDIMQHAPYPATRSALRDYESTYAALYEKCRRNRFRSLDDIRPIAFLIGNCGRTTGAAVEGKISHAYVALWRPDLKARLDKLLKQRDMKTICLNDVGIPPDARNDVADTVRRFLEAYYPLKSPYER
ncbi:MAG: stealth conserved region 3 domain-containing protein, partial [Rubellimicrobium sp.]|nr:stealth conserved region 3 domain-containing protein [Rubellimicrobium sp.]